MQMSDLAVSAPVVYSDLFLSQPGLDGPHYRARRGLIASWKFFDKDGNTSRMYLEGGHVAVYVLWINYRSVTSSVALQNISLASEPSRASAGPDPSAEAPQRTERLISKAMTAHPISRETAAFVVGAILHEMSVGPPSGSSGPPRRRAWSQSERGLSLGTVGRKRGAAPGREAGARVPPARRS
ncbi:MULTISPECIES: hypothetical protein [unclassified Methylobacterium]|uniref:hypothetical protein n=1 Tax=unclassified Methylobacterium TaxID=2615210 RepID=UPI001F2FF04A|nr:MULTISPECIES: hypothetical protein [Methylobacterium]WFT82130.1 hypothetical protein QA634_09910 [Methylobacterium nodulans]